MMRACLMTLMAALMAASLALTTWPAAAGADAVVDQLVQPSAKPRSLCQQRGMLSDHGDYREMTTLNYFGTSISVRLYDSLPQAEALLCQSLDSIERMHQLASDYSTYPGVVNIKSINNDPTAWHQIDPELLQLVAEGIDWHQRSLGHFNIALGPVVQLWRGQRFACEQGGDCRLPDPQALKQAALATDISAIELDREGSRIRLGDGMSLDLGGIAKGWLAERLTEQLLAAGAENFVINAGGNVRHHGLHPSGRDFTVAIEDPLCKKSQFQEPGCDSLDGAYQQIIRGRDITVVSSGNYLKYFEVDGVEYHHIIDPKAQAPKQGLVSVSVIMSAQHQDADALSTTLFLLPLQQAQAMVESMPHVEAIWYLNDQGERLLSSGMERYQ